jgi:hypothetical protein
VRGGAPKGAEAISAAVREICLALPEITEHVDGWARNFCVRHRSFCLVIASDPPEGIVPTIVFRAGPDERDVLLAIGRPFFEVPKNPWKVGLVLSDDTDWNEVRELVTESYCLVAPKKLVALLDLPFQV